MDVTAQKKASWIKDKEFNWILQGLHCNYENDFH